MSRTCGEIWNTGWESWHRIQLLEPTVLSAVAGARCSACPAKHCIPGPRQETRKLLSAGWTKQLLSGCTLKCGIRSLHLQHSGETWVVRSWCSLRTPWSWGFPPRMGTNEVQGGPGTWGAGPAFRPDPWQWPGDAEDLSTFWDQRSEASSSRPTLVPSW